MTKVTAVAAVLVFAAGNVTTVVKAADPVSDSFLGNVRKNVAKLGNNVKSGAAKVGETVSGAFSPVTDKISAGYGAVKSHVGNYPRAYSAVAAAAGAFVGARSFLALEHKLRLEQSEEDTSPDNFQVQLITERRSAAKQVATLQSTVDARGGSAAPEEDRDHLAAAQKKLAAVEAALVASYTAHDNMAERTVFVLSNLKRLFSN